MRGVAVLLAATLAGPAIAGDAAKEKRPKLGMRATPRFAFAPISVLFTAQLSGGTEVEDLYCPGLQWDWGDGETSFEEGDCAPFSSDTVLDRLFMGRHAYRQAGRYDARLSLTHAGRTLAVTATTIAVQSRVGGATGGATAGADIWR